MSKPASPILIALTFFMSLDAAAAAADGSVTVERLLGQAQTIEERSSKDLVQGAVVEAGTRIRTDAKGRVEFSVNGIPTLFVGSDVELLLHSYEPTVVRARLTQGAIRVDARSAPGRRSRDVRLNVGELRVRIADAEAWAQQTPDFTQVCLVSAGVVEVKQGEQLSRIDLQGQCLRVAESTPSWARVPAAVLDERIAQILIARPDAEPQPAVNAASAPAATGDDRSWSVVLASVTTQEGADREATRLKAQGVLQAEVRAYRNADRSGFRVGAGRYVSREEADVALTQFKKHYPKLSGWVARY